MAQRQQQFFISEEIEETIWEDYEKQIPYAEMAELREKYDPGWNEVD